ncbi:MAG: Trm112 family protein [Hyphomonas sp.]|nr:Trm112 family protein [Hyphomonas sp.]
MTDSSSRPAHSGVDPRLLEILICPQTRQPLHYDAERGELISPKAKLAYPIRGGIPVMLVDEARDLTLPDPDGGAA